MYGRLLYEIIANAPCTFGGRTVTFDFTRPALVLADPQSALRVSRSRPAGGGGGQRRR